MTIKFGNQGLLTEGNEVNEEKADYRNFVFFVPICSRVWVVQNRTQSHLIKPLAPLILTFSLDGEGKAA
jgi:hypothetical protein